MWKGKKNRYTGSPHPAVSVPTDSQSADFLGALIVMFWWVLGNPYNLHRDLKPNISIKSMIFRNLWVQNDIFNCNLLSSMVSKWISGFCGICGTHVSIRTYFTSHGYSFPPKICWKRGLPLVRFFESLIYLFSATIQDRLHPKEKYKHMPMPSARTKYFLSQAKSILSQTKKYCPRQKTFCPGQNILSMAKSLFLLHIRQ